MGLAGVTHAALRLCCTAASNIVDERSEVRADCCCFVESRRGVVPRVFWWYDGIVVSRQKRDFMSRESCHVTSRNTSHITPHMAHRYD